MKKPIAYLAVGDVVTWTEQALYSVNAVDRDPDDRFIVRAVIKEAGAFWAVRNTGDKRYLLLNNGDFVRL